MSAFGLVVVVGGIDGDGTPVVVVGVRGLRG